MGPRVIDSLDALQSLAGQEVGQSEWIPVEQETIHRFAELTGDRQWIHLDEEKARSESPWGTTVAHGFLTLSHISRMAHQAFLLQVGQSALINYGLNRVRFPAPVPAGAAIRGHFQLLGCGPRPGAIDTVWQVTVEAKGQEKPVCVAEWILRLVLSAST